jgi:hypothetical protein
VEGKGVGNRMVSTFPGPHFSGATYLDTNDFTRCPDSPSRNFLSLKQSLPRCYTPSKLELHVEA